MALYLLSKLLARKTASDQPQFCEKGKGDSDPELGEVGSGKERRHGKVLG